MNQPAFAFWALDSPPCAFGLLAAGGPHHCAACRAERQRLSALFWADVEAGIYNSAGYKLSEWKKAGYSPETWRSAERRKEAAA